MKVYIVLTMDYDYGDVEVDSVWTEQPDAMQAALVHARDAVTGDLDPEDVVYRYGDGDPVDDEENIEALAMEILDEMDLDTYREILEPMDQDVKIVGIEVQEVSNGSSE
jgi:hypothetical protein